MGLFWIPAPAPLPPGWVTLGSPFPPSASVSPWVLGGRCSPRWGAAEGRRRQGPGGSGTAHCGGPGPPGPAEAARGAPPPGRGSRRRQLAAPQLQPQHLPRPDGAGAAGPSAPPSGCSRRAGGGARAEPEPSRLPEPCPRRCPPPGGAAPRRKRQLSRSASARAAPPLQVRVRSRRCKVLGGTDGLRPGPAPPGAAGCLSLGFLRAALRGALRLHRRPRVTRARLQSSCSHRCGRRVRGLAQGLQRLNLSQYQYVI